VNIVFNQVTYEVTFFEGGLPSGTPWTVTVDGVTQNLSTTYFLTVYLPNGTFAWNVTPVAPYVATPAEGNITVLADSPNQVILFAPPPPTYSVSFLATQLPSGDTWTVYFGSSQQTGTGTKVTFQATNGTWTYAIGAPSGQTASPSGGSLTVNGGAVSQTISFSPTPSGGTVNNNNPNFLGALAYALIGLFVVLALIFLVLAIYWRGRKPPAAAPPQSWESTDNKGTTAESSDNSTPPST